MLQITFACNIYHIIGYIIESDGVTYFFGDMKELRKTNTLYIGKQFVK